jgi:hypothetical protein
LGGNPGLAALWEDERQRRLNRGEDDALTPPESPGMPPPLLDLYMKITLDLLLARELYRWTDTESALQERLRQIVGDLNPPSSNPSSQSTLVFSDDEDEPRVCESSILRVVSCSQSFRQPSSSQPGSSTLISCDVYLFNQTQLCADDASLLRLLTDLADEDHDSILASQKSSQPLSSLKEDNRNDSVEGEDDEEMAG